LLGNVGKLERLRVRVYVDEPELGRVSEGEPVTITGSGFSGAMEVDFGSTPATIDTEFGRICRRLGVDSRDEALLLALSEGWVSMDRPTAPGGASCTESRTLKAELFRAIIRTRCGTIFRGLLQLEGRAWSSRRERSMRRVLLSSLAAGVLGWCAPMASADWTDTGWMNTSHMVMVSGGPGAAGYTAASPYVYAYQAQSGQWAYATGQWQRSWTWTDYSHSPGDRWLGVYDHAVGTIGFLDGHADADYSSSSGHAAGSGPPDYDQAAETDSFLPSCWYCPITARPTSDVQNYGHASAGTDATLGSSPPA